MQNKVGHFFYVTYIYSTQLIYLKAPNTNKKETYTFETMVELILVVFCSFFFLFPPREMYT